MAANKSEFTKDTGYAWIILLCAFLTRTIDCVLLVTFGIFILEFIEYFNLDQTFSATTLVSCYFLTMALAGPFGGVMMKRFGVRPVMTVGITFNVVMLLVAAIFPHLWVIAISYAVAGVGFQLSMQGVIIYTQSYFEKRRSFASGVLMSGVSCGTFIWPPIVRYLIDLYTWRGALYILAGVSAQIFIFILLMRPPPMAPSQEAEQKSDKNGRLEEKKQKKNLKLQYFTWILYMLSFTAQCAPHFVPMSYYPMKGQEESVGKYLIPILVSISGGLGIVSRPVAGLVTDKFNNRIIVAVVSLVICGGLLVITAFVHTFAALLILAIFIGIIQGFYIGTANAQWVDVFGLDNITLGSGLAAFAIGMSAVILHPVAGVLVDLTGNTDAMFLVFGGVQIISGILLFIVKLLLTHQKNSRLKDQRVALY